MFRDLPNPPSPGRAAALVRQAEPPAPQSAAARPGGSRRRRAQHRAVPGARARSSTPTTKRSACAGEGDASRNRGQRHELWSRACCSPLAGRCPRPPGARGVSPYLPLNLSPEIERQIERVLILADRADHLAADCGRDRAGRIAGRVPHRSGALRARAPLPRRLHAQGRAGARERRGCRRRRRGDPVAEPARCAQRQRMAGERAGILATERLRHRQSRRRRPTRTRPSPTGSMLSVGFDFAQLDIGYRDHWFSPFTDSAMIISTEARTLPSVTLSNYRPLDALRLRYEVFLAEMEHSDRIRFEDGFTAGKPRLAGLRFSIEPAPGWSLSANRLMQYGGGERGGDSFGDFLDALFKPHQKDNRSDTLSRRGVRQPDRRVDQPLHLSRAHAVRRVSRVRRRGQLLRGQLPPGQRGAVGRHHLPAAVAALRSHVRSERVAERLVRARHLPRRHDQRRSRARSLGRRSARLRRRRRRADAHAARSAGSRRSAADCSCKRARLPTKATARTTTSAATTWR